MAEAEVPPLRWRRDGTGYVTRPDHAGATYRITGSPYFGPGRKGKLWRLYVDGVELPDAAGCGLRYVKSRADYHAETGE